MSDEEQVERVAKVIDPDAWERWGNERGGIGLACWPSEAKREAAFKRADQIIEPSLSKARAAIAAVGRQWRPIDSAPKDGIAFLACTGNWITTCHWNRHQGCWTCNGPTYSPYPVDEQPMHWMPLPSAPVTP